MSKILNLILILCICMAFMQYTENPALSTDTILSELTVTEKNLVRSDNTFGFKLLKEIVKEQTDKNIFISPLSISMALGMTYNGASGTTQKAMQETLELADLTIQELNNSYKHLIELLTGSDPKVQFQIANSIWYRQEFSFEKEFIDLSKIYFNAQVRGLDFNDPKILKRINGWVDENTNGKIKKIVDVIDPFAVMFLINAIYFKGTWTYEFDKSLTNDEWFNLPDGSQESCEMMRKTGKFQYFENSDFQAIELPYGDGDFSMSIFLPHSQKNLDSLIAEFNQENFEQWINSFSKHEGTLEFPKFTIECELTLNDILKALGMAIAFDPYQANFTRMYKGPESLYISEVKHKAFVKINEEGTEAAAVTSVEMRVTSIAPSGFLMRVDRPFVFVIRENCSKAILFVGKIVKPALE
ncbi:serpin family protein [Patescibacteria group bacterium]|nr:serpin family protein [Patescibacteria group bacterium]